MQIPYGRSIGNLASGKIGGLAGKRDIIGKMKNKIIWFARIGLIVLVIVSLFVLAACEEKEVDAIMATLAPAIMALSTSV